MGLNKGELFEQGVAFFQSCFKLLGAWFAAR